MAYVVTRSEVHGVRDRYMQHCHAAAMLYITIYGYVVTRSEVHGPRSLPSINFQIFLPSTNGLDTVTGFSHALMEVVAASCCYQELSLKNDILERSLSRLSAISSCLLNRL